MDIKAFFKSDLVLINKTYDSKNAALTDFSSLLEKLKYAKNSHQVLDLALKREGEFSTGIGNKIAIPHIRDDVMNDSVVLFAKVSPLEWESLDNQKVEYIFFIAMNSATGATSHLEVIAALSRLFMKQEFINLLPTINSYETLISLLEKFLNESPAETQNEKKSELNNETIAQADNSNKYDVVAITACPTGIAHTFMAAQKLEDAAKAMNLKIKVETQGTEGPRNVLSQNEINEAKGVILAVDKIIDTSRFSGKNNVLELGTKAVIKDSKQQLERILKNEGKTMAGEVRSGNSSQSLGSVGDDLYSFKGFGKRLWKAVMNGVSYMLPFVIFGGILIALSFLIDINNAGAADFGKSIPASKWFNSLGNIAFSVIVPILCAYIAYGLVGKLGLLPGFVCGFISSGKFLFNLDPKTGAIDWFAPPGDNGASSGFFGAIIGGFLSAIVIIVFFKYIFGKLPKSLNGIKNILFIPLLGTLAAAALFWIIDIPLIYLNYGFFQFLDIMSAPYLAPLLGLVIGIMMASDLGGPINKAAYVFSTATLTSTASTSGTIAMAASMLSGMVPPLAIALAATFFKKLYDKETRSAAFTNYIMGISFVTEGAIPFTAENPKVMVPANLIGGGIAGLLSGALGVTLLAPHGGIFVFALVRSNINPSWDASTQIGAGVGFALLSIIVASVISAFIIFFLNKAFKKSKLQHNKSAKLMNFKNWFHSKNKAKSK